MNNTTASVTIALAVAIAASIGPSRMVDRCLAAEAAGFEESDFIQRRTSA